MQGRDKIFWERDAKQLAEAVVYDAGLDIRVVSVRRGLEQVAITIVNIWNSWKQRDEFKRLIAQEFELPVVVKEYHKGSVRSTQRLVSYAEA